MANDEIGLYDDTFYSKKKDAEVCELYKNGGSIQRIADKLNISRQRVQQILRYHKIEKRNRDGINRDEFLGVTLNESDKTALRTEAKRRGISMSTLTANLIKEMLEEIQKS